eukprot:5959012-Pyramimonas_sp.AAC.1
MCIRDRMFCAHRWGISPARRRPRVGGVGLMLEPALPQRVVVDVIRPAPQTHILLSTYQYAP